MRIPLPLRIAVSAFGPVFVALWVVAEAGRSIPEVLPHALLVGVVIAVVPWWPRVALVLTALVPILVLFGVSYALMSTTWPVLFGMLIPVACAAATLTGRWRWAVIAVVGWVAAAEAVFLTRLLPYWWGSWFVGNDGDWGWTSWIGAGRALDARIVMALMWAVCAALIGLGAWALGAVPAMLLERRRVGASLARAEADLAEARVEQAVLGERARIARDVHDAMAHSLSIVVAQADGALAAGTSGAADSALATIAEAGRRALSDVRGLLERIDGEGPALGASDIPALIEDVRAAGLAVRSSISGDPAAVPPAASLAAYRIVQESLTNALRHTAAPASVDVTIDWRGAGAVLLIASSGPAREGSAGAGRGIAGMTERARLLGGWLAAGLNPGESGGEEFVVTATLPYPVAAPAGGAGEGAVPVDAVPIELVPAGDGLGGTAGETAEP